MSGEEKSRKVIVGDDSIDSFEADWLGFGKLAVGLANQLYTVSKSSGVCCGIIGSWGSGKSSFMKLMDEYARKRSGWKNVRTVWFTAWDPGGIEDLGDALLYQFFQSVVGKEEKMAGVLNKLKEALGVRRSLRERARRVMERVTPYLPQEAKVVASAASGLLKELESSVEIRECFDKLMEWLEEEKRTVFLFIDDVDRASGEQILDLLSELRLYVSRRRVVAVLGYSEDYVVKALRQVLPKEIEPREYLEKIITVKRNVPTPAIDDLEVYAANIIKQLLPKLDERTYYSLGSYAACFSFGNPRKLKRLILTFTQVISPIENYEKISYEHLESMLFTTTVFYMGFLVDEKIAQALEDTNVEGFRAALQEFVNKNPDGRKKAELISQHIPDILYPGTVTRLRLAGILLPEGEFEREIKEQETFDWRRSFLPILSSSAEQGFTLISKVIKSPAKITVPPHTHVKSFKGKPWIPPLLARLFEYGYLLSWNDCDMFVFLTSHEVFVRAPSAVIELFFNKCPRFVAKKSFVFWLVDDAHLFDENFLKHCVARAQRLSEGLKNPCVFCYTPYSKVEALLEFFLNVTTSPKQSNT